MKPNEIEPGHDLLMKVRGAFIYHNSSLSKWCRDNEIEMTHARDCLLGGWNGPKAKALRAKLVSASRAAVLVRTAAKNEAENAADLK